MRLFSSLSRHIPSSDLAALFVLVIKRRTEYEALLYSSSVTSVNPEQWTAIVSTGMISMRRQH
jgi:hypothetical protein